MFPPYFLLVMVRWWSTIFSPLFPPSDGPVVKHNIPLPIGLTADVPIGRLAELLFMRLLLFLWG
jgi:hypothetical protein